MIYKKESESNIKYSQRNTTLKNFEIISVCYKFEWRYGKRFLCHVIAQFLAHTRHSFKVLFLPLLFRQEMMSSSSVIIKGHRPQ